MGDRITVYKDCPKCRAKGAFECYEALSSNMKIDECTECGYTVNYDFIEHSGYIEIKEIPSDLVSKEKS